LVEIGSVTSEIRRRRKKEERKKKEEKTTAVKYKPFDIAMPCGLNHLDALLTWSDQEERRRGIIYR